MIKRIVTWGAIALLMAGCSSSNDDDRWVVCPIEPQLTRGEQEMVEHNNDFAFKLMREVITGEDVGAPPSRIVSPISITYALGMLNNGAAGETRQQINKVLGFENADSINNFCRKMLTLAPTLDPQTKVLIANTIYMNKGYELKSDFVKKASLYYDAQPETRDFGDGKTMDVINQWAGDHTEKMIDKVLDEKSFNPNAVSYLLNAIYFKGEWSSQFDKANTQSEAFHHAGWNMNMVYHPIMRQTGRFDYAANEDYQALRMPYGNEAYAMTVILPQAGKSISQILQNLTAERWSSLQQSMRTKEVDVKLPRFETKTDVDLTSMMANLGMPNAFSSMTAEFPEFCDAPTFISLMKQVARIQVNEEGTEAAAVTVIGMEKGEGPVEGPVTFHAIRPFLYVISEQFSGAIFFIGQFTGN